METNPVQASKKLNLVFSALEACSSVLGSSLVAKGLPPLSILSPASPAEQREQFRTEGKVSYPHGVIKIQSVDKNIQGMYNDSLRRVGINAAKDGTLFYNNYTLIPISMPLSFRYVCQSYDEAITFCEQWLWAEMDSQFYLRNDNFKIPIKLIFAENTSFPEMNFSDNANIFSVDTSLTMLCYSARLTVKKKITSINGQVELETADGFSTIIENLPFELDPHNEFIY